MHIKDINKIKSDCNLCVAPCVPGSATIKVLPHIIITNTLQKSIVLKEAF
jgi:hypothetical protein